MLHVLKKISNSLSTDNSIPIFGYSINEADIASASFFLCYYHILQGCVLSPPHSSAPNLTSRTKLRPQSPFPVSVLSNFWDAVQKGMSRVQISLFYILDEQFGNRRGKNPLFAPVLPYTMNETAPKGTASFYVSAVRRPPCYVINYFLAALAAFLFSFHTYASYIIGVPMKMDA